MEELGVVDALRRHGARFAFVHGSRAAGEAGPTSDLDVAAWWGSAPPAPWDVVLPDGVDLLVLDTAPLELAGRVALRGRLLFEVDPAQRVRWQATTRLLFLDEEPLQRELDAVYFAGRRRGR
ncbi:MAG: nucleotidyltransferase domain-containing protein [Acidimicrobiales bacterium]